MQLNFKQSLPYLGGFLGAVVLATAAFVGGYWYRGIVIEQSRPGAQTTSPSPSPEIEAQVISLDHGLDMSDWVTSTSENLGISLKHPKGWYGMDFTHSGGVGISPAFGLTFPIRVDLNQYQQITAEGEEFRLKIITVDSLSISEAKDRLDREAEVHENKLGYFKTDRKQIETENFSGLLNYYYPSKNSLGSVFGYFIDSSGQTYLITFSSYGENQRIDRSNLEIIEQMISTLE